MDTPDRNQIGTPVSKYEDSPVFNYINSLSPIKPVKSINIAQTFNSLTFSSPPSVFTSPHLNSQRESRFLRRNVFSGSSKPEKSSDDVHKGNSSEGVSGVEQVPDSSAAPLQNFDGHSAVIKITVAPPSENIELAVELPQTLKYDCGSPECNRVSSQGARTGPKITVSDMRAPLSQFSDELSVEQHISVQSGVELHDTCQTEQIKEDEEGCDWENLISDTSDLLIFDSSNNEEASQTEKSNKMDIDGSSLHSSAFSQENTTDKQISQPLVDGENNREDKFAAQSAFQENKETNHTPDVLSSAFQNKQQVNFPSEILDDKSGTHIPFGCERGVRRRCLVFESSGARKRKTDDDSNSSSSASSQSDGKYTSGDKQLDPIRPCTTSSSCMIPGIGLHLNALASTTKDTRVVKHATLNSGKELIRMPSSLSSVYSLSSEQNPLCMSSGLSTIKSDTSSSGNDLQGFLDASRVSIFRAGEDLNETSPKKKRRRSDHGGESEACKRCNCKKSKCLKLYCECFAAGVYCVEPCSCHDCFNKPVHEDTVLATRKQIESRNPLAFAPKVIRSSDPVPEVGEESNKTPASARHKRGCNCKKSNCLKKYCECYQGGVGCSINCRCEGCKNAFGRKDGSIPMELGEIEAEDEEAEANEKNSQDGCFQTKEVRKDGEQFLDSLMPLSFSFQICRTSVQLPFSSFGKPPRASLPPRSKFEKHFQISPEDETPEILRGNSSPISGIKTCSPNSKRVSPPHREFTSSPSKRNSRKLVLQSIPSFPSLNQQETGDLQ